MFKHRTFPTLPMGFVITGNEVDDPTWILLMAAAKRADMLRQLDPSRDMDDCLEEARAFFFDGGEQ